MGSKGYCARDDITTECEVYTEGDSDSQVKYANCPKKEWHRSYIPVEKLKMKNGEFKMDDLPEECRSKEFMKGLQLRCDLTVKVILNYTSTNRPDTFIDSDKPYPYSYLKGSDRFWRSGTGYIRPDSIHFPIKGRPCPCKECEESGDPKMEYLDVSVFTATHLVFDNEEAVSATFECFYDYATDRTGVKILYGRTVTDPDELKRCVNDSCVVNCVTHDPELIEKLIGLAGKRGIISLSNPSSARGIIISHPHGLSKQIAFGKILYCGVHKDPRLPNDVSYEFGEDARCRVPASCCCPSSQQSSQSDQNDVHPTHEESANSIGANENSKSCTKQEVLTLTYDTTVSPRNEYSLPSGMTFKLPLDTASFCTFQLPVKYNSKLWVKFPKGTEFFLPDGRVVVLPPETEFCWRKGKATVNNKSCLFVAYDIPTCTGSSGASVFLCDNSWSIFPHFPHCGVQQDGHNRSSNIMLFCYYETWMAFPSINSN